MPTHHNSSKTLFLCPAWREPHPAVQWVSVHGSPEVQRQPVRRGGDAAGEVRPGQHRAHQPLVLQHVDEENAYLCGYLKIKNLTDEYPEMVTFFDGELISDKHPFLTRKWDADEDVDKKHWVGTLTMITPECSSVVTCADVLEWSFVFIVNLLFSKKISVDKPKTYCEAARASHATAAFSDDIK